MNPHATMRRIAVSVIVLSLLSIAYNLLTF